MSDLEATSSRTQSAAPITAVATGKLRAIAGNHALFAQSEGLVDAFAEVFARMAESSGKPIESPAAIAETEDVEIVSEESQTHSEENAPTQSDAAPATSVRVVDLGQPIGEVEQVEQANDSVIAEDPALRDQPGDVVVDTEVPVSDEIVVADVEVPLADTAAAEVEAPQVIAPVVVQSDGQEHSRRHRRDSASNRPIENTAGGHLHQDRSSSTEQTNEIGEETGRDEEQRVNRLGEDERAESPRRVRGRARYTREATESQAQPVSQANQARTQQRAQPVAGSAPSHESIGSQSGPTDAVSSPQSAKTIESQIAHVQNTAAGANRSASPGRVQTGTRGTTQAIESTLPTRGAVGPKPDSPRINSNTQETVSRIKLIQRVSKAFQHLGENGGVVRLRLAPAEMGSVRVEMRIQQRKVQARVVAETEAASKALREHLPDLRARLESFGMQVDKIEIETDSHDTRGGSPFGDDSQEQGQQQGRRHSPQQPHRTGAERGESVSPAVSQATAANPAHGISSGVDVRL